MSNLKLRVAKSGRVNPQTKQKGFAPRVLTNGTADFDDITKEAGHNTTMHKAELKMAFELCLDSVAEMLKQGYIVDLGPLGKIYPSCSAGWYEKEEDMKLSDVKPQLYYRAGDEVEAAIKSAKLVLANAGEEEEDDKEGPSDGDGDTSGDDDGPSSGDGDTSGDGSDQTGGGTTPPSGGGGVDQN